MKNNSFIKIIAVVLTIVLTGTYSEVSAQSSKKQKYKVAVCDWMILKDKNSEPLV